MKLLFLLLDSLNRRALSCYGGAGVETPAFDRIAERGIVLENHYVGSLPCMPARRDLLTGRLNFLHRSWGPVEPYDRCFPAALRSDGVYAHLVSDHYHYWEEGGAGYHNQYSSAELVRGQERDLWKAMVQPPVERFRALYHPMLSAVERRAPNMVNREFIRREEDFPTVRCVARTREFLERNHDADRWLLQLELFDPHEPFTAPARFREKLPTGYEGPILDWPVYDRLDLTDEESAELRANYLAVVAMCDHHIGTLLDDFDRLGLWEDTAIVVTTDHGFLLGEHGWWGKNRMPLLDPVVHIPLIVYHPALRGLGGARRRSLTQCLDVTATLLECFGCTPPETVEGRSLMATLEDDSPVREHALFGLFGGAINVTDGRHCYFRYPPKPERPLYEYTLMPLHPQSYFTPAELRRTELVEAFDFTRGVPLLRIPALDEAKRPPMQGGALADARTVLYDLERDPEQATPVEDEAIEAQLVEAITALMARNDAPAELYARFGLAGPT